MPKIEKPKGISEIEIPGQPYSTVVQIGNHFHFSGIVAINEDKKPNGDAEQQIIGVFTRMLKILNICGLTFNDVYSVFVDLSPWSDEIYTVFNKQWDSIFGECEIKPRRKVKGTEGLPFGCAVEIIFDACRQSD